MACDWACLRSHYTGCMARLRLAGAQVIAKAYDNPIPGYGTATVGNLRLWEALPVNELNLGLFNEGKFSEVGMWALIHSSHRARP